MNNTPTETQALAEVAQLTAAPPAMQSMSNAALIISGDSMDKMMRLADIMASGRSTIPAHLQKSPGDCLAVVMQAMQWGMNPFAVAQKTYMINGRLGYEAQLVAAVINNSQVVQDRFRFEWFGPWEKIIGKFKEVESKTKKDDNGHPKKYIVPDWNQADERGLGIKVSATIRGESAPRELTLLMTQARTRNSTLWTEDPKQQLAYLAQARWSRLYAPDVILGVYMVQELELSDAPRDMGKADEIPDDDWKGVPDSLRKSAEDAASRGVASYQAFWGSIAKVDRKTLAKAHEYILKDKASQADAGRTVENTTTTPKGDTAADGKTFDEVMRMLCDAQNPDALMVAQDWIAAVPDSDEREILTGKFNEIKTIMKESQS